MVLHVGIVLGRALCHVVLASVDLLLALVELGRGPGLDARAELVLPGHLALDRAHAAHAGADAGMLLGIAEILRRASPSRSPSSAVSIARWVSLMDGLVSKVRASAASIRPTGPRVELPGQPLVVPRLALQAVLEDSTLDKIRGLLVAPEHADEIGLADADLLADPLVGRRHPAVLLLGAQHLACLPLQALIVLHRLAGEDRLLVPLVDIIGQGLAELRLIGLVVAELVGHLRGDALDLGIAGAAGLLCR